MSTAIESNELALHEAIVHLVGEPGASSAGVGARSSTCDPTVRHEALEVGHLRWIVKRYDGGGERKVVNEHGRRRDHRRAYQCTAGNRAGRSNDFILIFTFTGESWER